MIDRGELIGRDSRGKELLQILDQMPKEGDMNQEEIEKQIELLKIYEREYISEFVKQHPDFPARAVIAFNNLYDKQDIPIVEGHKDLLESWTIPTNLSQFQMQELSVALILKGTGCSERLVAEFLGRNRETIRKYLSPITRAIEESLTMDKADRDAHILPVARDIIQQLEKNTAGTLRAA